MTELDRGKYWTKAWNVFTGCTPVADTADPCAHCWAREMTRVRPQVDGGRGFAPTFHRGRLDACLPWRTPQVVFANNCGDWLHPGFTWQQRCLMFDHAPLDRGHVFLTLTKRYTPLVKARRMTHRRDFWHGATAWDFDSTVLALMSKPHWLSLEPLLGPAELDAAGTVALEALRWVVVGCESGPGARACGLHWIAEVITQCRVAGIPCFVKQVRVGHRVSHDPSEWPPELRVRELPPEMERILRPCK